MDQIIEAIGKQRCIIFAGAGISCTAGLPDWLGLGQQLCDKLIEKSHISKEDFLQIEPLVRRKETIPVAIDLIQGKVKRHIIVEILRDVLEPKTKSTTHDILKALKIRGYLTTNYDHLLEQVVTPDSFRLSNSMPDFKQLSLIVTQLNKQFLLKLHGDIDNMLPPDDEQTIKGGPFMVLSKSDYVAFQMSRGEPLRSGMLGLLQHFSVLFLGYSFGDPDINSILSYLTQYNIFSNPSWFVTLKGEKFYNLPSGVQSIHPFNDWSDLPEWLNDIHQSVKKVPPVPASKPSFKKFSKEEINSLKTLGEYLTGLESGDLCDRVLAGIIIEEIRDKEQVEKKLIIDFISNFLNVGPSWAETFSKCALRHLVRLGVIKELEEDGVIRISKTALNRLHQKADLDWKNDRVQFFDSVKNRLVRSGLAFDSEFIEKLESIFQDLCMNFGQQMSEWILYGIGREIEVENLEHIITTYLDKRESRRVAKELIGLILDNPTDQEVNYLYRLISAAFLLNSIKLDPGASKFLKQSILQYELYLDSNVILPFIVQFDKNHHWIFSIITATKDIGVTVFVLNDIWEEVQGHREVALHIYNSYKGNLNMLSQYELVSGSRANCFIKGFLRMREGNKLPWRDYMSHYRDNKLDTILGEARINKVDVDENDFDISTYKYVLDAITDEWDKRWQTIGRNPKLNEHEAVQYLQIYKRRKELLEEEKSGDVWFLSAETVLEKVYLRNPQKWTKPPTFPLSAWASFLDSHLVLEQKNRKDILTAILKGNTTAYGLPDSEAIVRKKAFGTNKILSEIEANALYVAVSDGSIISRLEKARSDLLKRPISRDPTGIVEEFEDATQSAVGEIGAELREQIENLRRQLSESRTSSKENVEQLEIQIKSLKKKIEELSTAKRKRKR